LQVSMSEAMQANSPPPGRDHPQSRPEKANVEKDYPIRFGEADR